MSEAELDALGMEVDALHRELEAVRAELVTANAAIDRLTNRCGGCRGLGSHSRYCARNPDYHPWKIHAARAESIGDSIGSNDPGLANQAYALSAMITAHVRIAQRGEGT